MSASCSPKTRSSLGKQRLGLRQPRLRFVGVARLQLVLGQVFQRGDGDLGRALAAADFERLVVVVECFLPGPEVTQHPACEVDGPAGEARDLAPFHLRGIPGERGQGSFRVPRQRVRVPGE